MKSKTQNPPQNGFRRRPVPPARHECRCGKDPFYSEEAAADALKRYQYKGQVDGTRRECRVYECPRADVPTWHLTSLTEAQYRKRLRQAMLATLWQASGTDRCRSISLDSPAVAPLAAPSHPYAGVITIRLGDPHA